MTPIIRRILLHLALLGGAPLAMAQSLPDQPQRQVHPDVAALCVAAQRGDVAKIDRLIAAGTAVDGVDAMGQQPIIKAIVGGSAVAVKRLLKHGADPNTRSRSGTGSIALAFAAEGGNRLVLQILIEAGAKPNLRGRSGGSALGTAALAGDFDTVSFLLDHGADPNGWCSYVREDLNHGMGRRMQSTALCGAAIGGHTRVTELLLRKGARVNVEGGDGFPLSVAATRGDIKMMTLLISAGADIDAEAPIDSTARRESPAGPAPVIAAIQYNFPDAVQLLIDRGARMTGDFHGPGGGSVEPLSLAKKIGNPRIIEMVSRALEKP